VKEDKDREKSHIEKTVIYEGEVNGLSIGVGLGIGLGISLGFTKTSSR
jgi:hypothetical protein